MEPSKFIQSENIGRSKLLLSFGTTFILFVVFMFIFTPVYMTNDDAVYELLVSGKVITGSPDEHILPTNILIGKALKVLYGRYGDFQWYGYYLLSVHFLSMTAFLYSILRNKFSMMRLLFFAVYFFTVELVLLMQMQFTTTAFVSAMGGIFLFVSARDGKPNAWIFVLSALLLIVSSLIRIESFFLALLLSIPLFIYSAIRNFRRRYAVFLACFLAIVLSISAMAGWYNYSYYERDPEWKDYISYRNALRAFLDYGNPVFVPETSHIFEKAGWSQNDFYMLAFWFFADKEVYSLSNMKNILAKFPSYKKYIPLRDIFSPVSKMLDDRFLKYIIASSIIFAFFIGKKKHFYTVFATFLLVCAFSVYLIFFMKLPSYIYFVLFAYMASLCLFFIRGESLTSSRYRIYKNIRSILIVIAVTLVVASVYHHSGQSRNNILAHRKTLQEISIMTQDSALPSTKKKLFVIWSFPIEKAVLPFVNDEYASGFRIYLLSLIVHSPIGERTLDDFGIKNIYKALYEKDNVFLISNDMTTVLYKKYIFEHYGDVVITPVYLRFEDYGIFKPIQVRDAW